MNMQPLEVVNRCRRAAGHDNLDVFSRDVLLRSRHSVYNWQRKGRIPSSALRLLLPYMDKAGIDLRDALMAGAEQ